MILTLWLVSWMAAEEPAFDRDGFMLSAGAGVTHCPQSWCSDSVVGGMGRLELGWRFRFIAPVAYLNGGGTPLSPPEGEQDGALTLLGTGVGARLFPVLHGRFDPFVGFSLGYSRIAKRFDDEFESRDVIKRGAAVFAGGLSIYVARHVALGARVDYTLPFAGELCAKDSFGEGCTKVKEIYEDSDDARERANRRLWPRPWSATLDVMFVF